MNATRPNYVSPRWIPTKDVAKLVRAYLKTTYPGQKFSVRSDSYSGGSAVRVSVPYTWTREAERELWVTLSPWGSSGFDGMTDSSYSKGHALCPVHGVQLTYVGGHYGAEEQVRDMCCANAEPVNLGASYVQVSREWQRPDGITRAADARPGEAVDLGDGRLKWVRSVDSVMTHDRDLTRITYTDGTNDTYRADVILTRVPLAD